MLNGGSLFRLSMCEHKAIVGSALFVGGPAGLPLHANGGASTACGGGVSANMGL